MKAIHGKCHLLLSTSKPLSIQVDRTLINSLQFKKPLGVQYDNKSKFETYIKNLCEKPTRKLNGFS